MSDVTNPEPGANDAQACMIFDDSCVMCSAAARWVERNTDLVAVPGSEWQKGQAGIGDAELAASVWTLDGGQHAQSETRAVANILSHSRSRVYRFLGRVLVLWGIRHVANVMYRFIARNRHRFLKPRG